MGTKVALYRSAWPVDSILGLHGRDENDLSAAFAYALSCCPAFRACVLDDLHPGLDVEGDATFHIQTGRRSLGITDVEVRIEGRALIVFEAKKGSEYPSAAQLRRYAGVCIESNLPITKLVALTSVDESTAPTPDEWNSIGVPVSARSWRWVRRHARRARSRERSVIAKFVLEELARFLEGFVGLERAFSNMVYVLSLAAGTPPNWAVTWVDVVEKHGLYFYPFGKKSWPPPPNYIAFRYRGKLQSIHHVESFEVEADVRKRFPGSEKGPDWGPVYLLTLGPPIRPPSDVTTGPRIFRSARVWCMLDALLTARTISEALDITERRKKEATEEERGSAAIEPRRINSATLD